MLRAAGHNTASSGVNYLNVTAAATGVAPIVAAAGSDTNIGLDLNAKGTGTVRHTAQAAGAVVLTLKEAASQTGDLVQLQNSSGTVLSVVDAAGSIGIGTSSVSSKAVLDMVSTTKGFLPPRMTTTQRDAISSPATGLIIYNTTTSTVDVYTGSAWTSVGSAAAGVPTGAIAAFASASCPSGWTEYTAARGRFLRGIDNGAGNDPSGTRAAGNTQADAFQGHRHTYTTPQNYDDVIGGSGTSARIQSTGTTGDPTSDGANGTPRTATETRPKNVAVTFCQYNGGGGGGVGVNALASLSDVGISSPTNGQALVYNSGSNTWVNGTVGLSGGSAGYATVWSSSSAVTYDSALYVDTTNHRVGIGTASPTEKLHLMGRGRFDIASTVALTLVNNSTYGYSLGVSGSANDLIFANAAGNERVRFTDGGNVGIGTATPAYMLDIRSGSLVSQAHIGDSASGDAGLYVLASSNSAHFMHNMAYNGSNFIAKATSASQIYGYQGAIYFTTNTGLTAGNSFSATSRMILDGSGNLGVGSFTPSARVDAVTTGHAVRGYSTSTGYGVIAVSDGSHGLYAQSNAAGQMGVRAIGGGSGNGVGGYFTGELGLYAAANNGYYAWIGHYSAYSLYGNGNIWIAGAYQGSDERLKEDIHSLQKDSALESVMKLRPVSFKWRENTDQVKSHKGVQYGLIAQEAQKVLPHIVTESETPIANEQDKSKLTLNQKLGKVFGVDYTSLVPWLLAAVQEIKELVDSLGAKVEKLIAQVTGHDEAIRKLQAENAALVHRIEALEQRFRAGNDNDAHPMLKKAVGFAPAKRKE